MGLAIPRHLSARSFCEISISCLLPIAQANAQTISSIVGDWSLNNSTANAANLLRPQLTAQDLENGDPGIGLASGIGHGTGKWRIRSLSSGQVRAVNLRRDPIGQLTILPSNPHNSSTSLDH